MYPDFWTEVAELWNDWEGGNLTNNAVRKRFKRRAKSVKDDIEYIDELSDELYVDNLSAFRQDVQDTISGEKSAKSLNNEVKSKTNFTEKAQEMGVKSEYQRFLEKNKIDPDDVTNVYFKEKAEGIRFTVQTRFNTDEIDFDPLEVFRDSLAEYDVPQVTFNKPGSEDRIAVINLLDAHIDKIASVDDSDVDSSLDKNIESFEDAFNSLLESVATKSPERILIPVGNDFFHTNDHTLHTKNGTSMADRVHVSGMEAFRLGLDLLRRCIDKARQIADVTLIPVPGNHDHSRIDYLLECLLLIYETQNDVEVLDNHRDRKYYRYGAWLFGFSHGDKRYKAQDIPQLMATDAQAKKHWSDIDKGVFFLGHIHHEKRYDYMKSNDFRGCKVMFLRSVGTTDQWHWAQGYTGIPKTAYAFLYSKDGNREQEFRVNI